VFLRVGFLMVVLVGLDYHSLVVILATILFLENKRRKIIASGLKNPRALLPGILGS
jgi:hypothetical protein